MITQGIYEHYKSTDEAPKLYQVLFLSRREETLEILVNYAPLYFTKGDELYSDGIVVWTRTLKNFTDTVEYRGKTIPRFKLISSIVEE